MQKETIYGVKHYIKNIITAQDNMLLYNELYVSLWNVNYGIIIGILTNSIYYVLKCTCLGFTLWGKSSMAEISKMQVLTEEFTPLPVLSVTVIITTSSFSLPPLASGFLVESNLCGNLIHPFCFPSAWGECPAWSLPLHLTLIGAVSWETSLVNSFQF